MMPPIREMYNYLKLKDVYDHSLMSRFIDITKIVVSLRIC